MFTIVALSTQIKHISLKLQKYLYRKHKNIHKLRYLFYKCHFIHTFVLLGNMKLNIKVINHFFFIAISTNLLSNTVIMAGFATHDFKPLLRTPLKIVACLQIIIISWTAFCFVLSSDALLSPGNTIYSLAIYFYKKRYKDVKLYFRICHFYENVNHRKPFRYNFGSITKITRKSLLTFWLFYFSVLFMVIGDLIRK